jgi:hypothetical protein
LLTDPLFLQECCVCLSSYEDGAELSALPCNHHFHWTCITKWLRMNATCPLCKYNILKGSDSAWPTYADITSAHSRAHHLLSSDILKAMQCLRDSDLVVCCFNSCVFKWQWCVFSCLGCGDNL